MKFSGKPISGPKPVIVAIVRDDGNLIFICKAVLNYDEYDKMCPEPKPPLTTMAGGAQRYEFEDPKYVDAMGVFAKRRNCWMRIQSIKDSPGLEWDTVDLGNPDTWLSLDDELMASNLTVGEQNAITRGILSANSMDEGKMAEARASFLATSQAATAG